MIAMDNKSASTFRPREVEILYFLAKCYTNDEIAKALSMKEKTVRNNISIIMRIAGVDNRIHLIRYAQEHGYGANVSLSK
jgi:DNA-binding NarL/FixJ family response regulator